MQMTSGVLQAFVTAHEQSLQAKIDVVARERHAGVTHPTTVEETMHGPSRLAYTSALWQRSTSSRHHPKYMRYEMTPRQE